MARSVSRDGRRTSSSVFPHYSRGSPSVPLTMLPAASDTRDSMARYSDFLGRRVEVQYRAGDILLPASGTFVGDSGRSIFLEQSFEQRGHQKNFRWEIPYRCIVRIEEKAEVVGEVSAQNPKETTAVPAVATTQAETEKNLNSAAASRTGG